MQLESYNLRAGWANREQRTDDQPPGKKNRARLAGKAEAHGKALWFFSGACRCCEERSQTVFHLLRGAKK